jgi:spore photoproduct lyase
MSWIKQLKKIYVNRQVKNSPLVENILSRLVSIPFQLVDGLEDIQSELRLAPDPIAESKRTLFLTREKAFIRPCPCTRGAVGCGYWTLDLDLNCPLDCSYCLLQAYFDLQPLTIAVNRHELEAELKAFFGHRNSQVVRLGTGELSDSLALDSITGQASFLAGLFRQREGVWLELKTKTASIDSLLEISPPDKVVVAWSLNSKRIIASEENGSASLEERLGSAARAVEHGYKVAFHFDPVIYYYNWEREYEEVIEELLEKVPAGSIAWISLGTLRFPGKLKEIARERFSQSLIFEEEFVRAWDGKFRYPKPLRLKIYKKFKDLFQAQALSDRLYLCMESPEVWKEFTRQNKKGKLLASPFSWLN